MAKAEGEDLEEFFALVISEKGGDNKESAMPGQIIKNQTQGYYLNISYLLLFRVRRLFL